MRKSGYFAAALAAFYVFLLWFNRFGPTAYGAIDVRYVALRPLKNAVVVTASPEFRKSGIVPGTQLDLDSLGLIARWRLIGAPRDYPLEIPIVTGRGTSVLHLPAAEPFGREQPFNWVALIVQTLALILAGYIGFRRPGVMTTALVLYTGEPDAVHALELVDLEPAPPAG